MNKRLKYEKYRGMDNIITIDLHNDYTVIAIVGKDENNDYDSYFVEIFRSNVNKLIGIEKICNKKISLDDVLYIGYDNTDLDVFKNVGYSSIVANGNLELKDYVDSVTFSNDEKGVEKLLNKMM